MRRMRGIRKISWVPSPTIDVVIPVHSAERPVGRAATSVLNGTEAPVRVTVVAHNIAPEAFHDQLAPLLSDSRLRLLHLDDGVRSPAGPMNFGFAHATAPFVALLGSDDELEPGALDSWLDLQRQTQADAVLARIQLADGGVDPYPPVRRGRRTRNLSGEADRLAYRSAPLGLISRTQFADLRLTEGLGSGEDLAYSLTVWFTGQRLAYDLHGPAYIVNGDAGDRVTSATRPLAEDFGFLSAIEGLEWFGLENRSVRQCIAVKLIRMHFFDALRVRLTSEVEFQANLSEFISLSERIEHMAPGCIRLLAAADRRVLDTLRSPQVTLARVLELMAARQRFPMPRTILPRNPFLAFHRQAPFRTLLAGAIIFRSSRKATARR